jgi:hypothetical protein
MLQVQNTTVNGNHFVGSCGIGRVLDGDLKVVGFSNLRVVDASAIPEMPANSGPAASVYMLAEHISDMIISQGGGSIAPGTCSSVQCSHRETPRTVITFHVHNWFRPCSAAILLRTHILLLCTAYSVPESLQREYPLVSRMGTHIGNKPRQLFAVDFLPSNSL